MGEAKRKAAQPRTVADIIAGRRPGVFGEIVRLHERTNATGYPALVATLANPVGLTPCECGKLPPHATVLLAGMPCGPGDPERQYRDVRAVLKAGRLAEIVGDIADRLENGMTLVSGFIYYDRAPRDMTVPDRSSLSINEHCKTCPTMAAEPRGGPRG